MTVDLGTAVSPLKDALAKPGPVQTHSGKASGQDWTIYEGSALSVLRSMEPGFVDCIVTSPPYFWLRDYGVEGQIGLEDTVESYVSSLVEIMSEARRVLRPEGVAFLNLGDTYYSGRGKSHGEDAKSKKRRFGLRAVDRSGGLGLGLQRKSLIGMPWRVALALAEDGWVLRSAIIWHRPKGTSRVPEYVQDRPSRSYEYVFMLAKSRRYHFAKSRLPREFDEDVWTISARPEWNDGLDTAPFPDELVKRCLSVGCPARGVVLDPFVGSGTTVRVAIATGRSGIGIDLNRSFCEYATRMLGQML
ncbi:MAG: site-specific DNA-methyltransferase [Acidobacteriota bacterium]|nr:site-specific DNA-methyltransferase [Acidobacteriota bacterium]MDE3266680.1 site-specific DNA-methyltransferase [Acidobacteriota bacterium]MXZ39846.1 site-specific DNA-methyltransferase [Holophagales bacterium]